MKLPAIADWDDAYSNGAYIEGAESYPPKWAAAAQAFRDELAADGRAKLDIRYGARDRELYDLFLPKASPKGLAVFVHGGYWMAFDKSSWSHLARGGVENGWAVMLPSYSLAPEAHLTLMTQQIARAIEDAAKSIDGPIRLSGHSAGGHLVTRQMCKQTPLAQNTQQRIEKVTSISGLHDLRPLMNTKMNEKLYLDDDEAMAESPALQKPQDGIELVCWVGAQERPEFLRQNRLLADIWASCGIDTEWHEEEARHHFNVIDDLADAKSALCAHFAPSSNV